MENKLTFLFDGGCPLCLRETNFLKSRDNGNQIKFVDINSKDYDKCLFNNISYTDAMSNLHGISENGEIIRGLDVLAYSYELIGLGWVYYPLKIKFLSPVLRLFYRYWAKYRLQITGRSNVDKICTSQCDQ
tara:strand:+ start:691 stop:1083 length:393 start_codon:yes stop_codon:yes gene_type:complete